MENKNVNNILDAKNFDFNHKYIYYLWCSENMGTPVFGKVKIVGKLSGTNNGKPFVEYKAERSMKISYHVSVDCFEDKYYNVWHDISYPADKEINKIYYSLNKKDIAEEYYRAYMGWSKKVRDRISMANEMLNDLVGGYDKFMNAYYEKD